MLVSIAVDIRPDCVIVVVRDSPDREADILTMSVFKCSSPRVILEQILELCEPTSMTYVGVTICGDVSEGGYVRNCANELWECQLVAELFTSHGYRHVRVVDEVTSLTLANEHFGIHHSRHLALAAWRLTRELVGRLSSCAL